MEEIIEDGNIYADKSHRELLQVIHITAKGTNLNNPGPVPMLFRRIIYNISYSVLDKIIAF